MSLFTSKIAAGVLAGGFTLAGAGLLFSGTDTLQNATNFVKDAGQRLAQFEQNEGTLLEKIGLIKTEAAIKVTDLNGQIKVLSDEKNTLESSLTDLNGQIEGLNADIAGLQESLSSEQSNHGETKAQLDAKIAELGTLQADLDAKSAELADLTAALRYAEAQLAEADKHVAQLENELIKANTEVEAHGTVVDQVKAESDAAQPLTQAEIDALDTSAVPIEAK